MSKLTPEQRLQRSHIQLMRSPQFCMLSGIIMMGKSEIVDDMPTAATNGRDKVYGREFVDKLTDQELNFVVAHENFHVLYKQLTVWQSLFKQNPTVANMACDHVINLQINALDPSNNLVRPPAIGILMDTKYTGWDSKRVFDDLMQNNDGDGDNGDGDGQGSFDQHQWDDAQSLSEEEKQQLSDAIDQAIRQGDIIAGKMNGTKSRDIGALPEPKVNWREQLRDFVSSVTSGRDSTTWRRPNRRWLANGTYMPSPFSESVGEMVIGVDTSGSIMADDINAFLSEIQSITDEIPPERIHLLYWDTQVAGAEVYEQGSYGSLVQSTRPKGGGGTAPQCVKEYIDNLTSQPEIVLMLSDGYVFGEWPDFGAPTIWGMTSNQLAPNATNIRIN